MAFFADEDVNLSAKKLYDVREFFNHCIKSKLEFCNMINATLLSKVLFISSPYVSIPEEVEFMKKLRRYQKERFFQVFKFLLIF